jgi:hypothetical protein
MRPPGAKPIAEVELLVLGELLGVRVAAPVVGDEEEVGGGEELDVVADRAAGGALDRLPVLEALVERAPDQQFQVGRLADLV